MKNIIYLSILSLSIFQEIGAYASPVKFYASNNSANNLTRQDAYNRLIGSEQMQLKHSFLDLSNKLINKNYRGYILQNVLGTYHISTTNAFTADNSIVFQVNNAAPLNDKFITDFAKSAAITLIQDSIGVFEEKPKGKSEDLIVNFSQTNIKSNYKLKDLDNIIKKNIPNFSDAYSVTLSSTEKDSNVDDAYVTSIEWLGPINKFENIEEIKIKIGDAFYVYRDGHKEIIH